MRVVNVPMRVVLGLPFATPLSRRLMLISFTGRRTGVAFLVTGVLLRRDSRWRAMGTYSLVAGVITLVLVGFMGWVFTPGTAPAGVRLGGLMERAVVIEVFAWYVAVGWWLLRGGSESVSAVPEAGPGPSMSTDFAP
jgi:hypothetical protein